MLGRRALRILAVDDSAVMREILRMLFDRVKERKEGPPMELCGVLPGGMECMDAVRRLNPDVLLLDLEMPQMDGLDVLELLRRERPGLPVIMCSGSTERGARSTLEALARGAADYVTKPSRSCDVALAIESLANQLVPRIAALAQGSGLVEEGGVPPALPRSFADGRQTGREGRVEVVVIGVSTGGPSALEQMLPSLAADFPVPVLIVQHMPKLFLGALVERLARCCRMKVEQACEGALVRSGTIFLAPGDAHMEVMENAAGNRVIRLHREEPLHHCMPAADYLFASAARTYGAGTLALVMTGMGADGLAGSRTVQDAGGTVLVQDKETSAVWGMPSRVFHAGVAAGVIALPELAAELNRRVLRGDGVRAVRNFSVERRMGLGLPPQEVMHGLL